MFIDQVFKFCLDSFYKNEVGYSIDIACQALKSLRYLFLFGFTAYQQDQGNVTIFNSFLQHLDKIIKTNQTEKTRMFIKNVGKFYSQLVALQPVNFTTTPGSINVAQFYTGLIINRPQSIDDLAIVQGMIIIKNLIKNNDFSVAKPDDQTTLAQIHLRNNLFTTEYVVELFQVLLTRYLPFSNTDLEAWCVAEDFILQEEQDHWEFNIRGCTEKLITILFSKNIKILTPILLSILKTVSESQPTDVSSIIQKDAVYCAIGLFAHNLHDNLDFDSWFTSILIPESQSKHQFNEIIRRRIAWIVGNWVQVKASKSIRVDIYKTLLSLMMDNDYCVCLTAINSLQVSVDDWDFNVDEFTPFLNDILSILLDRVSQAVDFDIKSKILNCLSVVIERVETRVYKINLDYPIFKSYYDTCSAIMGFFN